MVKEVTYYIAEDDPEETKFCDPIDAKYHEDRLKIVRKLKEYVESHHGRNADFSDLSVQDWVELVALVQRETPA
jgi:hypothetical protein